MIQVADEQQRFHLGELRRRFKRDDGATCASIYQKAGFYLAGFVLMQSGKPELSLI